MWAVRNQWADSCDTGNTACSYWWTKVVRGREVLLWWGVLDEFDTLLDVALETLDAGLKELLLLVGDTIKNVDGFLNTVGL